MRWERLLLNEETPEGNKSLGTEDGNLGPGNIWGHTCNSIKGGKYLYVFGGFTEDQGHTDDVHIFDTTMQTWSKPMVKGNPPSPRDSHSCTTVENNLFVFGGTDGIFPFKDLHILDTSSDTWISPNVRGEEPEAREGHGAALFGKNLFIFGGCGKSSNNPVKVLYNNLYILDTDALVWRHAITSGTPPSPRCNHTCSAWKNKMIVVSGEDESHYYFSDVHILDTDTLVWRELCTSGEIPPPRAGHSAVAFGKYLFVFGGYADRRNLHDDLHMLDMDTGVWIKVVATEGPCARFSVAIECVDPIKGVIVFTGGCNVLLKPLDDMYYLHTDISMENDQDVHRPEKVSVRKELKRKCQEQYLSVSLPVCNRDVPQLGTSSAMCRTMLMPCYNQADISEKVSLRKELKRKCQEQYLPVSLPVSNRDVPQLGTSCAIYHTMPMPCYNQAANKRNSVLHESGPYQDNTFEAKVTEAFPFGYKIETISNGQHLHGILLSYNPPGFGSAANAYLNGGYSDLRQSTGQETGHAKLNVRYKSKLAITRPKRKKEAHTKTDDIHGEESTSKESRFDIMVSHSRQHGSGTNFG